MTSSRSSNLNIVYDDGDNDNKEIVRKFISVLREKTVSWGFNCIDEIPGRNWFDQLHEKLDSTSVTIVVILPNHDQTRYAARLALLEAIQNKEKYLIPICLMGGKSKYFDHIVQLEFSTEEDWTNEGLWGLLKKVLEERCIPESKIRQDTVWPLTEKATVSSKAPDSIPYFFTDRFFHEISEKIVTVWWKLGIRLRLKSNVICKIEKNSPGDVCHRAFEMLKRWNESSYTESEQEQIGILCQALRAEKQNDLLNDILNNYKDFSKASTQIEIKSSETDKSIDNDIFLLELAARLPDWYGFFVLLNVSCDELQILKQDYPQDTQRGAFQALVLWRSECGCLSNEAKMDKLIGVLQTKGRQNLVDWIKGTPMSSEDWKTCFYAKREEGVQELKDSDIKLDQPTLDTKSWSCLKPIFHYMYMYQQNNALLTTFIHKSFEAFISPERGRFPRGPNLMRQLSDDPDMKIFQLRSNLLKLGTVVLQKLFDYRVGYDFTNYLTSNEAEETKLHWLMDTNIITKRQVTLLSEFSRTTSSSYVHRFEQTLLPPSDQTPSSSLKSPKLDITLLAVLLRYVCGLRAPNDLVWKEPSPMDMSIEAGISRLGQCRNRIMKLKHLDEESVDELSKELREILTSIGRRIGITDDFFSSTGDAKFDDYHDYIDDLHMNEWYANDLRQIQFEQGYAPKMIFNDSDDDAWTIDEERVSVLLSEGKLPNAKQLRKFCEKFGSSSPTVRKVCAYICNTLQMRSHHIKRCWPAYVYDKNNETDTNLVTFVAVKNIEDKLYMDQIFGYNIYELFRGSNRSETSVMMDHDIKNANKFNDEMDKIEKYVSDHSLSLMHNHSNITLIAGSTVKSKRYMFENKEIIENPCVVIYVHKKGYIPLGEKPFPTKLDDEFDTDVRECVISLFRNDTAHKHNDNLLMGTSISNPNSAGTLGGFVEHSRYGLCGLTCAHVLCGGHLNGSSEVQHWSHRYIDVFQPAFQLGTPIGKVKCALLRNDNRVGIDIALFSILGRYPISGQFAIDAPTGLNRNEYNSGSVFLREDIQRGAVIIKYGSETGRTETQVAMRSSCFKDGEYTLNKQLLVKNKPPHEHFAVKGDSGALSFVENDNGLHAMGVVVAGDDIEQTCCLTPLSDILDALNEDNTVQVTMKDFNVPGEPMQ